MPKQKESLYEIKEKLFAILTDNFVASWMIAKNGQVSYYRGLAALEELKNDGKAEEKIKEKTTGKKVYLYRKTPTIPSQAPQVDCGEASVSPQCVEVAA
jgi:hypothetical protein